MADKQPKYKKKAADEPNPEVAPAKKQEDGEAKPERMGRGKGGKNRGPKKEEGAEKKEDTKGGEEGEKPKGEKKEHKPRGEKKEKTDKGDKEEGKRDNKKGGKYQKKGDATEGGEEETKGEENKGRGGRGGKRPEGQRKPRQDLDENSW
jgi:hypothetical protein